MPRSPGEPEEAKPAMVPTNPNLLLREAAVALAAVAIIFVVALVADAPLGPPANPGLSPNPAKAPWYFAGVQELLVHFHPTFALMIVLALALGAFFVLPYVGGGAGDSGVWFGSAVGRRTAIAGAAAAALITPGAVILDEVGAHMERWMPGWPLSIRNGWVPTVLFGAVLAAQYAAARVVFRAPRADAVHSVAAFLVSLFGILTLICVFFRVEGMKLGWISP